MINKLFVYGTLCPGRPNEHVLNNIGGSWEAASVKGILLQEGWGAKMGSPGIVLDQNGEKVDGFVFSSNELDKHWSDLDAFEGEEYKRVLTTVILEDKSVEEAFIYVLKRQ